MRKRFGPSRGLQRYGCREGESLAIVTRLKKGRCLTARTSYRLRKIRVECALRLRTVTQKIPDTAMTAILPSGLDHARSDKKDLFEDSAFRFRAAWTQFTSQTTYSYPPYLTIAFSMRPYGVIEGHMKSTICQNSRLDKSCLHIQFHRTAPPRCRPSRTTRRMPRESARHCHKKPAHRNPWPHRRTRTRQVARTRTATCRRRDRPARYP